MGLLEAYKSPNLAQIPEQFRDPAKIKGNYSSAIYLGVLGFGINPERLKKLNLPTPKCWKDLADPAYRNEIQAADPQSSGTGYTQLATYIQLWGEEEAFNISKNSIKTFPNIPNPVTRQPVIQHVVKPQSELVFT